MSPSPVSIGDWLAESLGREPAREFLRCGAQTLRAGEFLDQVARAAGLFERLGVGPGDRVVLLAANRPELLVAWMGLARIGAITVALHAGYTAAELGPILKHAEPRLLVLDPALECAAAVRSAWRGPCLALDRGLAATESWAEALADSKGLAPRPLDPAAPANILYTSGTTGAPKAVIHSHTTYVLSGRGFAHWLGLGRDDRLFTCLPLSHINAQAYSFMGAVACGGSLALAPRFSASSFWAQLGSSGATQVNTIGAMLEILRRREPEPVEREHRVRLVYTAPAPAPGRHLELELRFGVRLISGYGLTESTFGLIQPLAGERGLGSLGRPRDLPGLDCGVRLVGEDGRDCGPDQIGEIWLRNPATMIGYFRDPDATAAALAQGWLHTGDLARRDSIGFYHFVDRRKHMIRRRGENVSALEVEAVLQSHPAILEAAVVGEPSELGEQEVAAYLVRAPGSAVEADALVAYCRERLAGFKVPSRWYFRAALPRTSTERIAKYQLKNLAP